jgi:hypothetical protein
LVVLALQHASDNKSGDDEEDVHTYEAPRDWEASMEQNNRDHRNGAKALDVQAPWGTQAVGTRLRFH